MILSFFPILVCDFLNLNFNKKWRKYFENAIAILGGFLIILGVVFLILTKSQSREINLFLSAAFILGALFFKTKFKNFLHMGVIIGVKYLIALNLM